MKQLTKEQRYTICEMKKNGFTQKVIAQTIGKDKSVISRELKRNCDKRSGIYDADLAQRKCEKRQKEKPKFLRFTEEIKQRVVDLLNMDYSPEQIAGRSKVECKPCVSHERIYQFIWKNKKAGGDLYTHLRRNGRKYRKRGNSKDTRGIIKDRIDITQRPKIVDEKTRFGDLEIDTIIGKDHKGAILTINDRMSNIVWIKKLSGKNAADLAEKAVEILTPYKTSLHTITSDNGKEFADHNVISRELGVKVYFAKPYHSWERGANENTNGLIRQYFKKGSSFDNITDEDVTRVQEILNNRPRKKLNYLSPNEFLSIYLSNNKVALVA